MDYLYQCVMLDDYSNELVQVEQEELGTLLSVDDPLPNFIPSLSVYLNEPRRPTYCSYITSLKNTRTTLGDFCNGSKPSIALHRKLILTSPMPYQIKVHHQQWGQSPFLFHKMVSSCTWIHGVRVAILVAKTWKKHNLAITWKGRDKTSGVTGVSMGFCKWETIRIRNNEGCDCG